MTASHNAHLGTSFQGSVGPIDLFASDMDGTLLDGDHSLCQTVADALKHLESNTNVKMCLATGRSRSSALKKMASRGFDWSDRPGVFLNGAVVYGPSGDILYENTFSMDVIQRLVEEFEAETDSIVVMPCSGDSIHTPQECEISMYLHREYADPLPVHHDGYEKMLDGLKDRGIHMIGVMTKDCRVTEQRTMDRVKRLISEFGPADEFSVVLPIPRMITLMPRNTSKGSGLLALCKALSVCPTRVAAVGDAGNDVEMIRSVGWGVAMGNAKDEVKMHARLVVNRNDHPELPGVAQLIHHISKSHTNNA